jgi:hypothetical protein
MCPALHDPHPEREGVFVSDVEIKKLDGGRFSVMVTYAQPIIPVRNIPVPIPQPVRNVPVVEEIKNAVEKSKNFIFDETVKEQRA